MKIIKVESCKECPYKYLGYSFQDDYWRLNCSFGKVKVADFNRISKSKYTKDQLNFKIPAWCQLNTEVVK